MEENDFKSQAGQDGRKGNIENSDLKGTSRDKIMGALVGSAIGDAMGAPIEMWTHEQIVERFGYVTYLLPSLREKQAEAAWVNNAKAGTTTDDTRWKLLVGEYLVSNKGNLGPKVFARFIIDYYENLLKEFGVKEKIDFLPEVEQGMLKINWILEWVKVSKAFLQGGKDYAIAQNKFYGGEMSCAGLLYSPMFALVAKNAEEAYTLAFDHCIFDIGYARDISSLVSVMTYHALNDVDIDRIIDASLATDPYGFCDSRLLGRMAKAIVDEARVICSIDLADQIFNGKADSYPGSQVEYERQMSIYKHLSASKKSIAFHAGEIWQILIASFEWAKGDFKKSLEFIVNYGRDNDTVAAISGMIIGAKVGFENIPEGFRSTVFDASKTLKMNFENLSKGLLMIQEDQV